MERIIAVKEWSVPMRINHWSMAITIFILIGTGFYIADPFTIYAGETGTKFFMGDVRFVHILFGVFLLFLLIWRLYLAFFSRFHADWTDFLAWTDWKCLVEQIKFYLLIRKDAPEHKCLYGPIQSVSYAMLLLMVFVIVVTGLILMGAGYHAGLTALAYTVLKPVENLMGGLATVRYIHHVLTWFFILFIVVHVYMAFWYDAVLKQGTMSSMIGGRLFERVKE
ncbi:MAG: Quinone-reactive Ni/Fe-hydrogenase B-type cytochrome subunit [Syntrophaceae bacterium PtaU1.Bin231]|nr:MAG: Quinone-reactive Ni/Fe-hydrogenase B-type cytochrome subunit [Syntrophaceae bacterium PtaU1.Bin231]